MSGGTPRAPDSLRLNRRWALDAPSIALCSGGIYKRDIPGNRYKSVNTPSVLRPLCSQLVIVVAAGGDVGFPGPKDAHLLKISTSLRSLQQTTAKIDIFAGGFLGDVEISSVTKSLSVVPESPLSCPLQSSESGHSRPLVRLNRVCVENSRYTMVESWRSALAGGGDFRKQVTSDVH